MWLYIKKLPDNVNLIAIISDVYDGIDSTVPDPYSILKDAGAKFVNFSAVIYRKECKDWKNRKERKNIEETSRLESVSPL